MRIQDLAANSPRNYLSELADADKIFLQSHTQAPAPQAAAGANVGYAALIDMSQKFLVYQSRANALLSDAQLEVARSSDRLAILSETHERLQSDFEAVKEQNLQLANQINSDKGVHIQAIGDLTSKLTTAENAATQSKTEAEKLAEELGEIKKNVETLTGQVNELSQTKTELEAEIERLKGLANKGAADKLGLKAAAGETTEKGETVAVTEKLTIDELDERQGSEPASKDDPIITVKLTNGSEQKMTVSEFNSEYDRRSSQANFDGGRHARDFRNWRMANQPLIDRYLVDPGKRKW